MPTCRRVRRHRPCCRCPRRACCPYGELVALVDVAAARKLPLGALREGSAEALPAPRVGHEAPRRVPRRRELHDRRLAVVGVVNGVDAGLVACPRLRWGSVVLAVREVNVEVVQPHEGDALEAAVVALEEHAACRATHTERHIRERVAHRVEAIDIRGEVRVHVVVVELSRPAQAHGVLAGHEERRHTVRDVVRLVRHSNHADKMGCQNPASQTFPKVQQPLAARDGGAIENAGGRVILRPPPDGTLDVAECSVQPWPSCRGQRCACRTSRYRGCRSCA